MRTILRARITAVASMLLCVITAGAASEPLAPWERAVGQSIENKGVAQFEQLGDRWVLNVICSGIHATYLDTTTIDLKSYGARYIRARYRYETKVMTDPKCLLAPCSPVPERRIAIERVTLLTVTAAQVTAAERSCVSPLGELR